MPPSGQPIIQASDANTCGGYPRMGVVIGADLWRLGQLRPNDKLRLVETDWEGALVARAEQAAYLDRVRLAAELARRLLPPAAEGQPA